MSFKCKIPTRVKNRNAQDAQEFDGQNPRNGPLNLGNGRSRDSDSISGAVCSDAFNDAWDDWLDDPTITQEFQPTAGLFAISVQAGPNVIVQVGSLSTVFTLNFDEAVPPSKWNLVETIELNIPWSDEDDLDPWRLQLHFMDTSQDMIPGVSQVFLDIPDAHPGRQNIVIAPNLEKPGTVCPPDQFKLDTLDGIDSATLNMADELKPDENTSPAPLDPPFEIDMIGFASGRNVVSPPLSVTEGP